MIITVANAKGGTKKTTTVLNLASLLKPDVIVDLDPHDSIMALNELRPIDQRFNVIKFTSKRSFVEFVINNKQSNILIDCGGFDSELTSVALKVAHVLIIPSTETAADMRGLMHTIDVLERENIKEAWLVPNGVHHAKKHFNKLEKLCASTLCLSFIPKVKIRLSEEVNAAAWKGLGVNERNKYCGVARDYVALANMVKGVQHGQ